MVQPPCSHIPAPAYSQPWGAGAYRYVPAGHTWSRYDGVQFHGEMIAPWKDYNELAQAQVLYEMINVPNEVAPTRIDEMEAQLAYISMMTDLM